MELIHNIPLSIKFMVEKKRGKNTDDYLLYARILLNRDKALVSLKMTVKEEDWDSENGQFFPTKNINVVRNNKLREVTDMLVQIYFTFKRTGVPVSAKSIKNAYDGNKTTHSEMEFIIFYKLYIEEIKQLPNEYGEGVIGHYNKTKTHLERFLKLHGWEKIKMCELSGKFLERFENYLLTTPNAQTGRPMNNNTCNTYIRKIKACVNAAVRKEIIKVSPFNSFRLKSFKAANRVSLTVDEVESLKSHDFGGNLALQRVRDCYLFCCATGLRHSDAVQLHNSMIKADSDGVFWINLFQKKTQSFLDCPMTNVAVEIYNRYEKHRNATGFVLPMLTNQRVNSYLKVIADIIGINKRLTFHSARHSYGTLSLEHGVDIASISSLMGHKTIKTTQIYAKMTRKRKVDVIKFLNECSNPTKKD